MECFKQFQEGGCGEITKQEMSIFIKKVAGLDTSEAVAKLEAEKERERLEEELADAEDPQNPKTPE